MIITYGTRVCSKCQIERPIGEYHKTTVNKSGRRAACKYCLSSWHKDREKTPELILARRLSSRRAKNSDKGRAYRAKLKELAKNPLNEGSRVCSICTEEKEIAQFYKYAGCKGSRASWCKSCHIEKGRRFRATESGKESRKRERSKIDYSKLIHYVHARKSRELNAPGDGFNQRDWEQVIEKFSRKCGYCGDIVKLTREHVEPLTRGGENSVANLIPACWPCNNSKGNKFILEWVVKFPERFV